MGGDHGLSVVIPACIRAVRKTPRLHLLLVGDETQVVCVLAKNGISLESASGSQFTVVHAPETVGMDELPSHVLRNKKQSSMRIAINLVKEGKAAACVSAGNTGALMGTARFVLKTLSGIDRPAIIGQVPTKTGCTRVIDLGANVDSCAEHLFQFAVMGSALIQAIDKKKSPKIALLNIGVEEIKGNDQVKRTAHILADSDVMNYVGYIEGDQIYSGDVDLVVCDGFVGNVALKASEGIVQLMIDTIKEAFTKNWFYKLIGCIAKLPLSHLKQRMDPASYNGATLLGLNGIVVKSHGNANVEAFDHAIDVAILQVKHNVTDLVRDQMAELINQGLLL